MDEIVKVTYITPTNMGIRTLALSKDSEYTYVDMKKVMSSMNNCVEYQMRLEASSVNKSLVPVWVHLFNHIITVDVSQYGDEMLEFEINEEVYKDCGNLAILNISCTDLNGNKTIMIKDGLTLQKSEIIGMNCKAKAYIRTSKDISEESLNLRQFSSCFTDTGPCDEDKSTSPLVAGGASVLVVVAFVTLLVAATIVKRRTVVKHTIKTILSPSHIIFHNTETLPEDLDTAAALQDEIAEEYKKLENYVKTHIDPKETTEIAKSELNSFRNRYQDMVPFDSNVISLSKETGF